MTRMGDHWIWHPPKLWQQGEDPQKLFGTALLTSRTQSCVLGLGRCCCPSKPPQPHLPGEGDGSAWSHTLLQDIPINAK